MYHQLFESPVGPLLAQWTQAGLRCVEFAQRHRAPAGDEPIAAAPSSVRRAAGRLERECNRLYKTGSWRWTLDELDWTGVSLFQRAVLEACFAIPIGCTATYGELARRVGRPAAARAVGMAMARNRWPIVIPCHRVVGAQGQLTGYSGVGGIDTKRRLLELEAALAGVVGAEFPVDGSRGSDLVHR
ncbi:MAG: methylated-DNA--[protein]-cysteine S-methyltransferase [Planctomycetota bacterium]|nr:MAG: methylated-DNA--[protein]-cysteine S-methyltransferase [Planctomycetota bacterium]